MAMKIRWLTLLISLILTASTAGSAHAKDEPRNREKGSGHAPAANHQQPPNAANGRTGQSVPQFKPNQDRSGGQGQGQPGAQAQQGQQLPGGQQHQGVRQHQGGPQLQGGAQLQGGPRLQIPQNQSPQLPAGTPLQLQQGNNRNLPLNPGAGGTPPGASPPQVVLPQVKEHHSGRRDGDGRNNAGTQQGGGSNPQQGVQQGGPNRIPPFNPGRPENPGLKNNPALDQKAAPGHGRSGNPGGLNQNPILNNPGTTGLGNPGNPSFDVRRFDNNRNGREHLPLKINTPIAGDQKRAVPLNVPRNGGAAPLKLSQDTPGRRQDQVQLLMQSKSHQDLKHNFEQLKQSPEFARNPQLAHLNVEKISGLHQVRLQNMNTFQHWNHTHVGQQLNFERQFQLQRHGDLTRQMNFSTTIINSGGWQHRYHGAIAPTFTTSAFSVWYAGGGCYPTHCWYPRWSPWVSWCWWDTCVPFYDPRPIYCRPVLYQPCQPWVYYQYPVWQPLPVATCGTWVDVQPVVVQAGYDLQLLAVRFVDNGHSEQNLGPRYRVWVRNNSPIQITSPFSVLMLAANDPTPSADLPQAGVVIPSLDIGEVKPVDIRLPLQANRLGTTPEGHRVPFNYLHVLVDSHQQIVESDKSNNGSVVARTDILPVDPAAFSTDQTASSPGATMMIAGEGFGPEPGRVMVSVNGQQTEATIQGWYDLGIRFTIPEYTLTGKVDADILVVRGDGAVSNPLDIDLAPSTMIDQAQDFPAAPVPDPQQ